MKTDFKALIQIKACRDKLTKQQYKTLKGQVLAGDPDAALKGLRRILTESNKKELKQCPK